MIGKENARNMYSFLTNKFGELCVWLVIKKKFVTMHGHMNVKFILLESGNFYHLDNFFILEWAQVVLTGAQKLLNHSVHYAISGLVLQHVTECHFCRVFWPRAPSVLHSHCAAESRGLHCRPYIYGMENGTFPLMACVREIKKRN